MKQNRGGLACSPIFERRYLSITKIVVFFVVVVVLYRTFSKTKFLVHAIVQLSERI